MEAKNVHYILCFSFHFLLFLEVIFYQTVLATRAPWSFGVSFNTSSGLQTFIVHFASVGKLWRYSFTDKNQVSKQRNVCFQEGKVCCFHGCYYQE